MKIDDLMLERIIATAREAASEVMAVYATSFVASTKADQSPLTEADLRADRAIRAGLTRDFPGIPIVSEESIPEVLPADGQPYFLVDPLDGTKEFVSRTGEFTVNIALIVDGAAVAGVVVAPALDETYYAAVGLGAHACRPGEPAPVPLRIAGERGAAVRVIGSRSHGGKEVDAWVAALPQPTEFVAAGSSLKFCRVAEGRADLYPRFGPTCLWDTAAAQCVLEQAGGSVNDLDGNRLRYVLGNGLLNPHFIACSDASLLPTGQVRP